MNRAKSSKRQASSYRLSSPEKAMALCVSRKVPGGVHNYEDTKSDAHLWKAPAKLDPQTFNAPLGKRDTRFKNIVGRVKSGWWYSPGAAGVAVEVMD